MQSVLNAEREVLDALLERHGLGLPALASAFMSAAADELLDLRVPLDTATRVEEPARVSAARFAAARTANAVEEMRAALGTRTAQAPIAPPRPPHPAHRQPPRGPSR